MKFFIIQILLLFSVNNCNSDMENTVWEIYNVSKEISNDSVDDAALGYMLNEKIAGTKIFIAKNKIKIKGNEFDVEANVVKITPEKIFIEENGEEVQIQYFLSSDKRECEFILADGTRLKAKREN